MTNYNTVTVTINRKINLGNYENIDVSVTMTKETNPKTMGGAAIQLGNEIKAAINEIVSDEINGQPFATVTKKYRGLEIVDDTEDGDGKTAIMNMEDSKYSNQQ